MIGLNKKPRERHKKPRLSGLYETTLFLLRFRMFCGCFFSSLSQASSHVASYTRCVLICQTFRGLANVLNQLPKDYGRKAKI